MILDGSKVKHDTSDWADYFKDHTIFDQARRYARLIKTIIRFAPKGGTLLEVGCGSGLTSILLHDLGYKVIAFDIDKDVLCEVKQRKKRYNAEIDLVRGDMCNLGFESNKFDVVFHQGVLEHFDDETIVSTLKEQKRLTKTLVFEVPNSRARQSYGDERLLSNRYWRNLISKAGLKIVYTYGNDLNYFGGIWPYGLVYVFYDFFGRLFGRQTGFVCV